MCTLDQLEVANLKKIVIEIIEETSILQEKDRISQNLEIRFCRAT